MDDLLHGLRLRRARADKARAQYTRELRRLVTHELAEGLRRNYKAQARSGEQVHRALRTTEPFRFYSALRVAAQDMVYQCVAPAIERDRERLLRVAGDLASSKALGSLTLDPALRVPRSVQAIDVHLMPGSYCREDGANDLTAGAVYDNRLQVSAMGLMGRNLDDIGQSIAHYLQTAHPEFRPRQILDLGCTVGHNTGAWKDRFPDADVHAIDVAAPCLRYALARARSQGRAIHFHQMNATRLRFHAASFDLVFSSMFLHELPRRDIRAALREAWRVLRPGGLMLHMELPPNRSLQAVDQFYLDWDAHYNNEPYYKPYRDQDPRDLCRRAGFDDAKFFEHAVASIGGRDSGDTTSAPTGDIFDARVGKLARGVRWYFFGAWK